MSTKPDNNPQVPSPPSLSGADWLVAPGTQAVIAAIVAGGKQIRAVGGAVRNSLMGLPVTDVDLATTALPDEVVRLAHAAGLHALPTGIAHGTVTVVANHVPFEVTTLRHDVETHGRHATVAFTDDWSADAGRRDFTVNALYCDGSGTVLDPLGGYPDLVARRIRFIGDARQRIREDYLRILRFFRFNAEYADGPPDAAGLSAAVAERDGLSCLSGERVRQELVRLLVARRAPAALQAMLDFGVLPMILGLAPRPTLFERLVEIEAEHGLEPDAMMRAAALAIEVPEDAERLAKRIRLSGAEQATLARGSHFRPDGQVPTEVSQRRLLYRQGTAAYRGLIAMGLARCLDTPIDDPAWSAALSLPARWQPPTFPMRGSDVLAAGIPPGPLVGEILREIESWWIAADFATTETDCRTRLAEIVSRRG